jgi:3',5'-cyclic AMP phosphodiesterase CpdA
MIIDPRHGDIADDASSTKQRSLAAIAGSLLTELSLTKLLAAWLVLIIAPALFLGFAALVSSAWVAALSRKVVSPLSGLAPLVFLAFIAALGILGGRGVLRAAEKGFWSLNSLVVEPGYAICRELLRHAAEGMLGPSSNSGRQSRIRAAAALGAGLVPCALALLIIFSVWSKTRWVGDVTDFLSPQRLVGPALANALVIISAYFASASLAWGLSDAFMDHPTTLAHFDEPAGGRAWRIAHLSDLLVGGERFGFRIASGRAGPRGNDRFGRLMAILTAIDADRPVDLILVTGDVTDAGRSAEWAEFLATARQHPTLMQKMLLLPGNHDLNVADRSNPARIDLPTSPGKRLRQLRALSAISDVQGDRALVYDRQSGKLGPLLQAALAPHLSAITEFADTGSIRLSYRLEGLWSELFPMVLPPDSENGLGVILLNSNAEAHFSFTNALGLVSIEQIRAISSLARHYPHACWLVALHHHLIEYPTPTKSLAERIGTALINGTWFLRQLQPLGDRAVAMHGHRHIDWIGALGQLRIVSAPSPVMEVTDEKPTHFYIHTFERAQGGSLRLIRPERIHIPGVERS